MIGNLAQKQLSAHEGHKDSLNKQVNYSNYSLSMSDSVASAKANNSQSNKASAFGNYSFFRASEAAK